MKKSKFVYTADDMTNLKTTLEKKSLFFATEKEVTLNGQFANLQT